MAWALWLSIPLLATGGAALWVWISGRPARKPTLTGSMQRHDDYLAALVSPLRGTTRVEPAEVRD